jgi:hypothetical protein
MLSKPAGQALQVGGAAAGIDPAGGDRLAVLMVHPTAVNVGGAGRKDHQPAAILVDGKPSAATQNPDPDLETKASEDAGLFFTLEVVVVEYLFRAYSRDKNPVKMPLT